MLSYDRSKQTESFISCRDARVVWDNTTGRSKGYGFIKFLNKEDAETAIKKMHGAHLFSRAIRCGWAQHKLVRPSGWVADTSMIPRGVRAMQSSVWCTPWSCGICKIEVVCIASCHVSPELSNLDLMCMVCLQDESSSPLNPESVSK